MITKLTHSARRIHSALKEPRQDREHELNDLVSSNVANTDRPTAGSEVRVNQGYAVSNVLPDTSAAIC